MQAKRQIENTYLGHLNKLQYATAASNKEELEQTLSEIKNLATNTVLWQTPTLFAIDYTKRSYLFFSNALGCYSPAELLEGGLDKSIALMPADYFKAYNEKVFPAIFSFLKDKEGVSSKPIVSFNHRVLNSKGQAIDTYQRCQYIMCKQTGLPTHCIGTAFDISNLKSSGISLTLESTNLQSGLLEKEYVYFHPEQESALLTPQEKKILNFIVAGLNSRQIADKLFISERTVSNHRANILRKTNCKNSSQLLSFASLHKLI